VFQLHPNGYKVAAGHVVKLELLPNDANTAAANSYGRVSNNQQTVTVENLQLRLPVVESPGALGGLVDEPAAKVVPPGYSLAAGFASPGYARPKGATPLRASLVPAYEACTSANRTHGPPLAFPSCNPPKQTSHSLTVGTIDANGKAAKSVGVARYDVVVGNPSTPADEADVALTVQITDVRNQSDLTDYTGELEASSTLRITDRANGASGTESGTVEDIRLPATVPCSATSGPDEGGECSLSTTLEALTPGIAVEGKRAIWQLGRVEVYDGGSDGVASTAGNTLFALQGVFVP
jgi:hypothetical protein